VNPFASRKSDIAAVWGKRQSFDFVAAQIGEQPRRTSIELLLTEILAGAAHGDINQAA
jgi:hypothetical protein